MPSPPVPLQIPGLSVPLQLHIHGEQDRYVSHRIRQEGIWEPYESALLLSLLQEGGVFVDVGANIGYFSILAASVVGERGAVFAFEPDPANFRLLQANIELNDYRDIISAVEAGLAATAGNGQLFLSEDNFGDHQIYAAGERRSRLPITLHNGSHYLAGQVTRVDLLKVDTQGSEYQVMVGLLPLLQRLPYVPRIIIELTPLSLRQAGTRGRALIELLATLGQPMWIIDHIEHRLAASNAGELARWCDNVDAVAGDAGFMNILVGAAV